ncbi:MAG: Serine-threonine protein phosphatase [Promethearchaeota archaeon CR_4]|nr:MAG: Serine-threonine protein phosphatase [Candidatus Lokiarchaeota archaeon CR_4]
MDNDVRILVMSDIYANLPTLRGVLHFLKDWDYDHAIICREIIVIYPYPAETIDLVFLMPNVEIAMGNHETYFFFGLKPVYTKDMTVEEIAHTGGSTNSCVQNCAQNSRSSLLF